MYFNWSLTMSVLFYEWDLISKRINSLLQGYDFLCKSIDVFKNDNRDSMGKTIGPEAIDISAKIKTFKDKFEIHIPGNSREFLDKFIAIHEEVNNFKTR
jgi:hypothetical protein